MKKNPTSFQNKKIDSTPTSKVINKVLFAIKINKPVKSCQLGIALFVYVI